MKATVIPIYGRVDQGYINHSKDILERFGFDVDVGELSAEQKTLVEAELEPGFSIVNYVDALYQMKSFYPGTLLGISDKRITGSVGGELIEARGFFHPYYDIIAIPLSIFPNCIRITPRNFQITLLHELGEKFDVRIRNGHTSNHHTAWEPGYSDCVMGSVSHEEMKGFCEECRQTLEQLTGKDMSWAAEIDQL
jgi:hypothetical protein